MVIDIHSAFDRWLNPEGYLAWEHKSTSTYTKGRTCIVGDAAHAVTPWYSADAGHAIEDAMIVGVFLSQVVSVCDIWAFRVFDALRRPRCQRIIDSTRETGHFMCGQHSNISLKARQVKEVLKVKWGFIHGLDRT